MFDYIYRASKYRIYRLHDNYTHDHQISNGIITFWRDRQVLNGPSSCFEGFIIIFWRNHHVFKILSRFECSITFRNDIHNLITNHFFKGPSRFERTITFWRKHHPLQEPSSYFEWYIILFYRIYHLILQDISSYFEGYIILF